jgi:surface protein
MNMMFSGCTSLRDIAALGNWNTSAVQTTKQMFYHCNSIANVSSLSHWSLRNMREMQEMFSGCGMLGGVDELLKWPIMQGSYTRINTRDIFKECFHLSPVVTPEEWDNLSF